ncbi:sigma-70 family RNA polymerase sigma factor [Candidatus Woesearchaeota archaeon]|nr:sigma-70 family RNA polymerase sigma factor [Candidatus Woesearchaeota archaeon]
MVEAKQELKDLYSKMVKSGFIEPSVLEHLIDTGKTKGYLTGDQCVDALNYEKGDPSECLSHLIEYTSIAGIEIVDAAPKTRAPKTASKAAKHPPRKKQSADFILQIYLREVGSYPLLKKEDEMRLAKDFRKYKKVLLARFCRVPWYVEKIGERFKEIAEKRISPVYTLIYPKKDEENVKERIKTYSKTYEKIDETVKTLRRKLKRTQNKKKKEEIFCAIQRKKRNLLHLINEFNFQSEFMAEIFKQLPIISGKQAKDARILQKAWQKYKSIVSEVCEGNLRLSVKIARKHRNKGVSFFDLIQAGNIGIIAALERYDPARGVRFGTFAYWWIEQKIKREIQEHSSTVRVPAHARDFLRKYRHTAKQLYSRLSRTPSIDEIMKEAGMSKNDLKTIRLAARQAISIDVPVSIAEDSTTRGAMIEAPEKDSPDKYTNILDARKKIMQVLVKHLSERERTIIIQRYGLNGRPAKTLDAIADFYEVSRERIRQLEKRAIKKLKVPIVQKKLEDLLD